MNKKTIKITSNVNKKKFLTVINDIRRESTDRDTIGELNKITSCLQNQEPSELKSALELDLNIDKLLTELKSDIENGKEGVTQIRLHKLMFSIRNRDKLCPHSVIGLTKQEIKEQKISDKANLKLQKKREKWESQGKPVASLYSEKELAEILLEQAYDELLDYEAQAKVWYNKLIKNKDDVKAKNRFKQLETRINIANSRIKFLENEDNRAFVTEQVSAFKTEYKDMIAKRKVSNDQFKILMKDFSDINEEIEDDINIVDIAIDTINEIGSGAGRKTETKDDTDTYNTVTGEVAVSKTTNRSSDDDLSSSPLFQKFGGRPDENEIALKGVLENIESIIAILKNSSVQFEKDKLKYDADIEDYEDKLLALKPEYENANASKSKSVADEIKSVNTFRVANIRNRDRIIRAKDQLNKQLEMAINLKGIKDIEAAKKRASEIMGQKFNFEDWAMFIKKYDKDENVRLDDLETIIDVSKSENINETTLPETDLPYHSDITKDEHFFDALWEEIKKRRKGGADEA